MKKCKKCKVGFVVVRDDIKICYNCLDMSDKKSKKILSVLRKNNVVQNYNKNIEETQKFNTQSRYIRFRVFVVGD